MSTSGMKIPPYSLLVSVNYWDAPVAKQKKPKHTHIWHCANAEQLACECGKGKKKPKAWKCECHPPDTRKWALIEEFNPNSSQQVLCYLRHQGYPIPRHRKTKHPTTDAEALSEIARKNQGDLALPSILEAKRYTKAMGYLSDTFLGRDGRLHPRYVFLKTGRLASQAPNIMNTPQGKKNNEVLQMVAKVIKSSILPTPGYVLAEFDWRAIEPLLTSFFADDPDYYRIAKLGTHAFNASFGLADEKKIPYPADTTWDDQRLGAFLDNIKSTFPAEYADFKKAGLADTYGQGIFNMARDLRCSVEKAKWLKGIIRKAFPRVTKWKLDTQIRAHLDGHLVNPFGYSLAFFDVLKKGEDGKWRPTGKEANEVLAFLPQSTCAAMLRWCLVELAKHPWHGDRFWLLFSVHDAIYVEAREDSIPEVMALVRDIMERKWPELGGLSVEVEAKLGATMGVMKPYHFSTPAAGRVARVPAELVASP